MMKSASGTLARRPGSVGKPIDALSARRQRAVGQPAGSRLGRRRRALHHPVAKVHAQRVHRLRRAAPDWPAARRCRSCCPGRRPALRQARRRASWCRSRRRRRRAWSWRCSSAARSSGSGRSALPSVPTHSGVSFSAHTSAEPKCSITFGQVFDRVQRSRMPALRPAAHRVGMRQPPLRPFAAGLVQLEHAVGLRPAEVQRDATAGDDRPHAVVHLRAALVSG